MDNLHHLTRFLGQSSLQREEFHETFHNLLTCLSCPPLPRGFFSMKELCGALDHRMMYSLPYLSFFSFCLTCPSHRKPEPHHWLGRMVCLCTKGCCHSVLRVY